MQTLEGMDARNEAYMDVLAGVFANKASRKAHLKILYRVSPDNNMSWERNKIQAGRELYIITRVTCNM